MQFTFFHASLSDTTWNKIYRASTKNNSDLDTIRQEGVTHPTELCLL